MRLDRKLEIMLTDSDTFGDRLRLIVYEIDDGATSVIDIIEGPFALIMQCAINELDKNSDLRVHHRKHFRK